MVGQGKVAGGGYWLLADRVIEINVSSWNQSECSLLDKEEVPGNVGCNRPNQSMGSSRDKYVGTTTIEWETLNYRRCTRSRDGFAVSLTVSDRRLNTVVAKILNKDDSDVN